MPHPAPLDLYRGRVESEWTDYNGHMNVAYYMLVFDRGSDALLDYLGAGKTYRERDNHSFFTLEAHINYLNELMLDEAFRCTTQLIDFDGKRIHYFQHLYREHDQSLAATTELILMHIDMATRRSAAMPAAVAEQLTDIMAAHRLLPTPNLLGSRIGIRRTDA